MNWNNDKVMVSVKYIKLYGTLMYHLADTDNKQDVLNFLNYENDMEYRQRLFKIIQKVKNKLYLSDNVFFFSNDSSMEN